MPKKISLRSFITALAVFIALTTEGISQPIDLQSQWDNGFKLTSKNGDYQLGLGANIQVDMGGTLPATNFPKRIDTGRSKMLLRRARLYTKGVLHEHFKYKFQVDFAEGGVAMKDVYLTIQDLPGIHNITIGHFKEPFFHDYLSSSKTLLFTERPLPVNLAPKRNAGIMLNRSFFNKRLAWFGGVFLPVGSLFNTNSQLQYFGITNRIAGLPLWQNEGEHFLHFGVAYSFRNPSQQEFGLAIDPESSIAGNYLTPSVVTDIGASHHVGGEAIWHFKALTIQGEYVESRAIALDNNMNNRTVRSYSTQFSWMLNGQRNYDRTNMTLDKIDPANSLMGKGNGLGGWELAARYSSLKLPGWSYKNRSVRNVTLGVNWYLTPGIKMAGNYIASFIDGDHSNILQFRFQLSY